MQRVYKKIKSNLRIYKEDLKTKGLYYSIVHRLYKIPLLKHLLMPIVNYLKPEYILVENKKLYIDKFDTTISEKLVSTKKWEDFETKLFKKNITRRSIVIDLGAHIGYYTLIASKCVGEKGKVYAFEPDPKNFKLLQKSTEANGIKNVVLINQAVTRKNGKVRLYLNKDNTGDHRVYDSKDQRKSVIVETTSLDDFFKNLKNEVNLIKMDIQGAELEALKGGLNLIKNNPHIKIFTEFWPMGLKLNHTSAKEYLKFLTKYKFKFYQILEDAKKLTPVTSRKLLKLYPPNNPNYTNLLCVRNLKS